MECFSAVKHVPLNPGIRSFILLRYHVSDRYRRRLEYEWKWSLYLTIVDSGSIGRIYVAGGTERLAYLQVSNLEVQRSKKRCTTATDVCQFLAVYVPSETPASSGHVPFLPPNR